MATRKTVLAGTATLAALLLGGVLVVLPVGLGIDPTGFGKASGLIGSAPAEEINEELVRGAKRKGVLTATDTPPPQQAGESDYYEVVLGPYEGVELKYTADAGAPIAFAWSANQPVRYDMHSHPFEGGEDLTESYGVSDASQWKGIYRAPFSGLHGWHWRNRNLEPVTLRLQASGPLGQSFVITETSHEERELASPPAA